MSAKTKMMLYILFFYLFLVILINCYKQLTSFSFDEISVLYNVLFNESISFENTFHQSITFLHSDYSLILLYTCLCPIIGIIVIIFLWISEQDDFLLTVDFVWVCFYWFDLMSFLFDRAKERWSIEVAFFKEKRMFLFWWNFRCNEELQSNLILLSSSFLLRWSVSGIYIDETKVENLMIHHMTKNIINNKNEHSNLVENIAGVPSSKMESKMPFDYYLYNLEYKKLCLIEIKVLMNEKGYSKTTLIELVLKYFHVDAISVGYNQMENKELHTLIDNFNELNDTSHLVTYLINDYTKHRESYCNKMIDHLSKEDLLEWSRTFNIDTTDSKMSKGYLKNLCVKEKQQSIEFKKLTTKLDHWNEYLYDDNLSEAEKLKRFREMYFGTKKNSPCLNEYVKKGKPLFTWCKVSRELDPSKYTLSNGVFNRERYSKSQLKECFDCLQGTVKKYKSFIK